MAHYFRSTGSNWGTVGDWSSTPSPTYTAVAAVPTTANDVIFEAASANCIVNTSNRVCKTINFTSYTNTITMTFNITVSGAITFGASMNVAGTGSIGSIVTSTITSNGYVWPNTFTLGGTSQTYTLASNMTLKGQLTCSGNTAITINSNTLTLNGGGVFTTSTSGTTVIDIKGGNYSGAHNGTVNLNSTGTITLTGNIGKTSGTLTYVAGTINNSGNYSLSLGSASSVNVGNNIIWNNITFSTGTTTLVNNLYASGNMITGNGGTINGAFTIYCTGITQNNTNNTLGGSATVELTGTGTWSDTSTNTSWGLNTVINCGLGTLTINTNRNIGAQGFTPSFTYTSGTIVWATTGIITFFSSTLSTNGMTFNNVRMGVSGIGGQTITLSNNMSIAGDLTIQGNGSTTINGNQINLSGSFINNGTASSSAGTTIINMNGTGSISTIGTPSNWLVPITINTSGTITWSGTNAYNGNLTYTAGTVVSTSSILNRTSGTMTINSSGFNLSTLNLLGSGCIFTGTTGFTIASLNCTTVGVVTLWKPGNDYTITTAFSSGQADDTSKITYTSTNNTIITASISGTVMSVSAVTYGTIAIGDTVFGEGVGSGVTIISFGTGSGGTGTYNVSSSLILSSRTIITSPNITSYPKITLLNNGATQTLFYTNAIDIDSSDGQTIWSYGSTLLRAFNWGVGTKPIVFSRSWVR
jgi:hypothetical protein